MLSAQEDGHESGGATLFNLPGDDGPLVWYGDGAAYWDERYRRSHATYHDWLEPYERIRDIVLRNVPLEVRHESSVLHVGCGNSRLSRLLYDDGLTKIVNTDISSVVIEQMADAHSDCAAMTWQVMDVTDMSEFDDESFDLVLDKGMFDTLAAAKDSLTESRRSEAVLMLARFLKEVSRVLRPGGVFLCVSHSSLIGREPFFSLPFLDFDVSVDELDPPPERAGCEGSMEDLDGGSDPNYAYTCRRAAGARAAQLLWPEVEAQLLNGSG